MAKGLRDSGLFEIGQDLEVVHAYFKESPAIIYRDLNNIEKPNSILNTINGMPSTHADEKCREKNMLRFASLQEIEVFKKLPHASKLKAN